MSYTKAEAVRLLESYIARFQLDAPYIAALESVASWAAQFVVENDAGRNGGEEYHNLQGALTYLAKMRGEWLSGMDTAQKKWAALDAGESGA